ncbi:MAG TPA: hypothetical protein VMH03_19110 [Terriglobales bacterium]|nr:hypothetical protein [Terriglobales bacterium]
MQGNPNRVGHLGERSDFARYLVIRLRDSRSAAARVVSSIKLIFGGVAILILVGCAHNPPPPPPPPPPATPAPTVAKVKPPLRSGDWIIRNCQPAADNSCYCHHPAEAIDANASGQQQHTVIECR